MIQLEISEIIQIISGGVNMNNTDFSKEIEYVNRLNNDDELFELEFNNISKNFPFKNYDDIHEFFSENRGLIVVFRHIKPMLDKQVPYAYFHLEMFFDTIFPPQLLLVAKALENDFKNGFKEDIRLVDLEIHPLLYSLNLITEFFIWDASCNSKSKNALTLKELYGYRSD